MARVDKIVSLEDFKTNIDKYRDLLNVKGELIIVENDKPAFVLKSVDEELKYQEIITEQLLQKVGKSVFVDFYYVFKEDNNPEIHLPGRFSMNSRRSRSSAARKIFDSSLEFVALKLVANSSRLDKETIDKSMRIYKTETNLDDIGLKDIKIGFVVKNVFPILLDSGLIDEYISELTSLEYCKETFGIYYPVLKYIEFAFDSRIEKFDHNKYSRYYSTPLSHKGKDYLLCSQWNKKLHFDKLIEWLRIVLENSNESIIGKITPFIGDVL